MASYLRPHDAIVALNDCRVDTVRDFAECASRATAAHFLPAPPPQRSDLPAAPKQLPTTALAVDGAAAYGGPGAWAQDVIADAARRRQPHRGFCVRVQADGPACRAVPGLPAEAECEGAEELCFTSLSLRNDSEPRRQSPSDQPFRCIRASLLCRLALVWCLPALQLCAVLARHPLCMTFTMLSCLVTSV